MKLFNRFRNAWRAFKKNNSCVGNLVFGVDLRKCSECDKRKELLVAYICDKKQCNICSYPECKHTFDINHAANFVRIFDDFWEKKEE